MEALKSTYNQYAGVFKSLSASQRLTLVVVTALIVGALGYLAFNGRSSGYVAASFGKDFAGEDLQNAQTVLRERGLNDFRQEGGKLLVPRAQLDQYNAALLTGGGLPQDWASELEKQFDKQSWFTSERQMQLQKDIARGKALRTVLRALPEVADAQIMWARSEPKRFSGQVPKVTATVNVKPKSGQELSLRLVQSIRGAVANMIADLKPADVTIFNLQTGQSYTVNEEGPYDGRLLELIKKYTRMYRENVEQRLSYIPGVLVTAHVKLDDVKRSVERKLQYDAKSSVAISESNSTNSEESDNRPPAAKVGEAPNVPRALNSSAGPANRRKRNESETTSTTAPGYTDTLKEYAEAIAREVKVSVGIPEDYFQKVAEKQSAAGSAGETAGQTPGPTREAILADVKRSVAMTVGVDPESESVVVAPYVKVDPETPELESDWLGSAGELMGRWGGPVGLGLFAVLALWMVKKSMPAVPEVEENPLPEFPPPQPADDEEETEKKPEPTASPRDGLQGVVRDNPEMTAAVLSQWLKTVN